MWFKTQEDFMVNISTDALAILEQLVNAYPGLIDGDTEVNAGDLVEALTCAIGESESLHEYLWNIHKIRLLMSKIEYVNLSLEWHRITSRLGTSALMTCIPELRTAYSDACLVLDSIDELGIKLGYPVCQWRHDKVGG
jgi:hypothetical protein